MLLKTIVQENLKNQEDCLPFIEFTYNKSIHSTTNCYSFEVIYGFNHLTPLNLILLSIDENVSLDKNRKAQVVKIFIRVYENK